MSRDPDKSGCGEVILFAALLAFTLICYVLASKRIDQITHRVYILEHHEPQND